MDSRGVIEATMVFNDRIVDAYLGDLTDEELLVRPVPKANHIAWQLGHLISSENSLGEMLSPGSMPKLPEGFAEKYTKETSSLDDPSVFHKKEEYLQLIKANREAVKALLSKTNNEDLDKPAPEPMQKILKTVTDLFVLIANHPLMHAGQWAVIRRKLGREPLF